MDAKARSLVPRGDQPPFALNRPNFDAPIRGRKAASHRRHRSRYEPEWVAVGAGLIGFPLGVLLSVARCSPRGALAVGVRAVIGIRPTPRVRSWTRQASYTCRYRLADIVPSRLPRG